MAYFPPTGSTVAFQSDPTKLLVHASVSGALSATVNNSSVAVMSTVPHSVAALQGTNPWVISNSSVQVQNIATGQSSVYLIPGVGVIGSVAALQGTNPWLIGNSSVQVNNIATGNSSVQLISTSASIATQVNRILQGNSSVQVISGIGVIGSVAVLQGTNPWAVGNSSVQVNNIVTGQSSVYLIPGIGVLGSVATLQGTTPWITTLQNASIAGTYAEDSAHTAGDRGIFTLGVRNDAVASFTSANLDYGPVGTDSAGRTLTKPFAPEESRVYGVASTVNTNPSSLLAAAGAGLRNYITDLWIANTGSVATLVSFRDVDASIIGKTIAPAGGGSNIIHLGTPMRTHALNSQVEFTAATAASILHVTAFGFKAP